MDPSLLSGVGSILGGLGGLFGKKQNAGRDTRHVILNQVGTAREAGEKYGFNPLTVLQSGAANVGGVGGGGGSPPLASVQMITEGLKDIDDVTSGDAARRRAADQLNLDLAQLRLDQARSGVVVTTPHYAADGVGSGPSQFGKRAVTVAQTHGGELGQETSRGPRLSFDGGIPVPDPLLDRGAGVYVGGHYVEPTEGWSSGQVIEDEYGDVASWGYGLAKMGVDAYHNVAPLFQADIGPAQDDTARIERESVAGVRPVAKPKRDFVTHPETGFSARPGKRPYSPRRPVTVP